MTRHRDIDRDRMLADMGRIIEVVRTFIPSERWPEVQAVALEGHAVHSSRSPSALRPGSGRVMAPSASRLLPN
jgi:hypothetical protein